MKPASNNVPFLKGNLINMKDEYEDVIARLQKIIYFLRIQGRHEEADLISSSLESVKKAANII